MARPRWATSGRLSIAQFAEDALALLLDHLGIERRVVVGGISLGARARACRIAALHPERATGLLASRGRRGRMRARAGAPARSTGRLRTCLKPTDPGRAGRVSRLRPG